MKNVFVIGSSLKDKGGIVTVMRNIEESELNQKYNFIHIDTYITSNFLIKTLIYIKGLMKLLININKIDIAHIHMSYKGSLYRKSIIIHLLKLFNKKVIVHIHGSCFKEFYNELSKNGRQYCKNTLNKVDKIIVLSESWKEFFETIVDDKKIIVIKNSVLINKKQILREKKEKCTFVFLGRQGKRKGIYDLLDVAEQLKEECNNFDIVIAGDGEIDNVNRIIKEKRLQNIITNRGWVNSKEKDELLRKADVFILPSYNEGLPMSILEAMSYKIPCIATKVGGIEEIINNGEDGFLFEPGNKNKIYEYMRYMISNINKRLEMGEKAFCNVEKNFNQKNELKKLEDLYKIYC